MLRALDPDLAGIADSLGLPDFAVELLQAKRITSASVIAQTFADEEQFVDFLVDEKSTHGGLKLKLVLKMLYFDACQSASKNGQLMRPSGDSSDSSAAPSPAPSESAEEPDELDEPKDEEEDEESPPAAAPAPDDTQGDDR
eukprot:CAMPEP_0117556022 /NCGR_PEP_ID=MMETSP0784-20121206/51585_1 /TAXON_ID=39447 /ORGANISM="" /LENGTH=140 /DNA_ID=CAMNT_0005353265 /DNA_START=54 /DNA_END=472 /DNA_ORIENTATION=+